ncbi:MAG TPA: hypothetical protein VE753_00095 [Gaiellaceae bacterium]|nr:hypothetical protein [Gaiellaceae bacterium]
MAALIGAVDRPHSVRVAIDGPDAAGKTTLADELAAVLRSRRRTVVHASIDGLHRPRGERYRRGPESPEGYCPALFDVRADAPVYAAEAVAPRGAVLLFDGIFLLRPELSGSWDVRIFVSVGFDEVLRRALDRDAASSGRAPTPSGATGAGTSRRRSCTAPPPSPPRPRTSSSATTTRPSRSWRSVSSRAP